MPAISIVLFVLVYCALWLAWGVSPLVAAVYVVASIACVIAYYLDKSAARAGRRRISERSLLLMGLAGGWPGAILAQQWFRHKSSKQAFRIKFWCTVWLNTGLFICHASPFGASLFLFARSG